ncbi:hypothetical protein IAT40_002620 [Kwoniella sp. CBS 6097]
MPSRQTTTSKGKKKQTSTTNVGSNKTSTKKTAPSKPTKSSKGKQTPKSGRRRAHLKQRKTNQAESEDEAEIVLGDLTQRKDLSRFPMEVLTKILGCCSETGREGCYIPQKTLSSACRVNTMFYLAAIPILYRQPIVMDIGSFLLGASATPLQRTDIRGMFEHVNNEQKAIEALRKGNTKNWGLCQVTRMKILPRTAPTFDQDEAKETSAEYIAALKKDARYFKLKTYERAIDILKDVQYFRLMPFCAGISIGSHLHMADNEANIFKTLSGRLYGGYVEAMVRMRYPLMRLAGRPKSPDPEGGLISFIDESTGSGVLEWCEWQTGELLPWIELSRADTDSNFLPPVITLHSTIDEPFKVQWGCTNRIIIRAPENEDGWERKRKRKLGIPIDPMRDGMSPTSSELGDNWCPSGDHAIMTEYENIELILNALLSCHPRRCQATLPPKLKKEVEDRTRFEFYGFETIAAPEIDLEEIWEGRLNPEWMHDGDVKMDYADRASAMMIAEEAEDNGHNDLDLDLSVVGANAGNDDSEDRPGGQGEDEDRDEEEDENASISRPIDPKKQARMTRYWLLTLDYIVFKSVQQNFVGKKKVWDNSDEGPGPKIRFYPFADFKECGGCGLKGDGWG